MRWLSPYSLVAVAMLVPHVALGAPPATVKVRDALVGKAREAFDRANALFRAGSFGAARVEFAQAYRASGDRRVLYNVAVCDKELHRYARAMATLEESLRDEPTLPPEYRERAHQTLALLAPLTTALVVVTEPGANVTVDEEPAGVAPLPDGLRIDVGEHIVVARKAGFGEARAVVAAASGSTARLELRLVTDAPPPLASETPSPSARLRVASYDPDARVFLDGGYLGRGPLEQQVSVGLHRIRIEREGEAPQVTDLSLNANEMRTITVTKPSNSATWWWVGGGIAVVAAVTTVVIVATTSETRFEGRSPGTLPPGVVAASF